MRSDLDYDAIMKKAKEEAKRLAEARWPPENKEQRKRDERELTRKLYNQMVVPK